MTLLIVLLMKWKNQRKNVDIVYKTMKLFNALFLAILIVFLIKNFNNKKEGFNHQKSPKIPDDLFSDGLDNNMGLNKRHRHHSF